MRSGMSNKTKNIKDKKTGFFRRIFEALGILSPKLKQKG